MHSTSFESLDTGRNGFSYKKGLEAQLEYFFSGQRTLISMVFISNRHSCMYIFANLFFLDGFSPVLIMQALLKTIKLSSLYLISIRNISIHKMSDIGQM